MNLKANAVSNTVMDLRQCVYKGKDLKARVLSGALLQDANFEGANLEEVVFSKVGHKRLEMNQKDWCSLLQWGLILKEQI